MLPTRSLSRLLIGTLLAAPVSAQAARRFTPVVDLRIDALSARGQRDVIVALAPDGGVVVAPRYGGLPIVAFDSLGKQRPWKIATGGRDDAEIGFPVRVGWIAGTRTMWIADQGYRQVALVDSNGKVFKSLEDASWLHPTWAERRKYPVFASMEAYAVYRDESWLVMPGRARSLLDTPGYDRATAHLLRASWSGSIQRNVTTLPPYRTEVVLRGKNCEHVAAIPFAARMMWTVSTDGSRIIVAMPGSTPADSGTIRVTAMGERGDTIFSRVIAQPAVRVPQEDIDNLLAGQRACGGFSAADMRDSLAQRITPFKSFLVGVTSGRDGTTWVTTRAAADTSMERTAVGLDDRGEIIGAVVLPANQAFVGADRGHIWTMESGSMRAMAALVRYRLDATPAPPPRSGRGGVPSTRSRPPA
jgi:hypothetical protein